MPTRKATRRKTSRKTPRRKPARKATTKRRAKAKPRAKARAKGQKKKVSRTRPRLATPEVIARKIVRVTKDPSKLSIEDLYAENCTSLEPGLDEPALGHEGLRAKNEYWEKFQDSSKADWKARNIFIKGNTIGIEWDASIVTRTGRSLKLQEIAIHEVKGGKIVAERYYYDRAAMEEPAKPATPDPAPKQRPEFVTSQYSSTKPSGLPSSSFESQQDPTRPKVDPIDL